jgi:hypothetical protein
LVLNKFLQEYRIDSLSHELKQRLLLQTVEQVEKDLNLTLSRNENLSFEFLTEAIEDHLLKLASASHSKIHAILYRVDISEAQLKKSMQVNAGQTYAKSLSELILLREFQKVYTRYLASDNRL